MKSRTCAAATTIRRSMSSSSRVLALFAMFALVGTTGCAMEAQPEEEGVTQSSALVEEQNQQVEEGQFDQAESTATEAELPTSTQSDDPTPVPWRDREAEGSDVSDDAEQVGNTTDPTPQPWDVRVLNTHSAQSQQAK